MLIKIQTQHKKHSIGSFVQLSGIFDDSKVFLVFFLFHGKEFYLCAHLDANTQKNINIGKKRVARNVKDEQK